MRNFQKGLLLGAVCFASGCGGDSGLFGANSTVEVVVTTDTESQIRDLNLVISKLRRPFNDPSNCSLVEANFCTEVSKSTVGKRIAYTFRTTSQASKDPFYVYVENQDLNESRRYRIQFFVNNQEVLSRQDTIPFLTIDRVARVYRSSVSD